LHATSFEQRRVEAGQHLGKRKRHQGLILVRLRGKQLRGGLAHLAKGDLDDTLRKLRKDPLERDVHNRVACLFDQNSIL
jgi:hypothetical protein